MKRWNAATYSALGRVSRAYKKANANAGRMHLYIKELSGFLAAKVANNTWRFDSAARSFLVGPGSVGEAAAQVGATLTTGSART